MRRLLHIALIPMTLATAALAQTPASDPKVLDSVHDVLLEVEHLPWLFCAFGIAFLLIFGYLYQISQKEKTLRRRIAEMQEMMEERWKKKG
jgi:CcmD family protein